MSTDKGNRKLAAAALCTVLAGVQAALAAINPGDNAVAFGAACALFQLTELTPPPAGQGQSAADELTTLGTLNMTLSEPEWQKLFLKSDGTKIQWSDTTFAKTKTNPEWANSWERWTEEAQKVRKNELPASIKDTPITKLTGPLRKMAQMEVEKLIEKTKEAAKDLHEATENLKTYKTTDIQALQLQAAFGTSALKSSYTSAGGDDNSAKEVDGCNTAGTVSGKQYIVYTMQCLAQQAGATTHFPLGGNTNPQQWATTTTEAAWAAIKTNCPKGSGTELTTAEIKQRLQALRNQIRVINNVGYLGYYAGTGCDGNSDNGLCVKYTDKITNTQDDFNKLTYVEALNTIADKLAEKHAAETKAAQAATEIKKYAAQVSNIPKHVTALQDVLLHMQPKVHAAANPLLPTPSHEECKGITKAALCREKQPACEWKGKNDDDGEYCKLNETHVAQQAKEAGPGGNEETKTTDKCGAAKTPEECAKVTGTKPEGKNAVCGWIEDKCKDSSILANKQFALSVVSAAFMALLF